MYSAWQGLFARTADNKKGELVADDWDDIARVLLGPNATGDNLDSVEAIMASLPDEQAQSLLAQVKQDKNWAERAPKISEDIRRMKKLAGLNEQAPPTMPNIQGLTPGQPKDLGDGSRVTVNLDGTVAYQGGFGTYVYSAQGKAIKHISPNLAGIGQSTDLTTNKTSTSYNAGPLSVKKGPDGEVDAQYDLGLGVAKMSKDAQGKTTGKMDWRQTEELNKMLNIAGLR